MALFGDREKLFTVSKTRIIYFLIFVAAFALTELGRYIYRPFVYRHGIHDFGIADTMGNSLGTVTQIFFMLAVMHSNQKQGLYVIGFITCGYMLYEIVQPYLPRGTFDWKDMVATAVAGLISLLVFLLLHRSTSPKEK